MKKIHKYIDKLLDSAELEWVALGEVCEIRNGYTPSKSKNEYWEGGTVPWFRMEDIRTNGRVLNNSIQHVTSAAVKSGKLFPENSIIMSTTATIGEHALITEKFLCNQQLTVFSIKEECKKYLNHKYLFYYSFIIGDICRKNVSPNGFALIGTTKIRTFQIPIPCPDNPKKSLAIQAEIVRILDAFTALTTELTTELTARKKQYHYYRDTLLTFSDDDTQLPFITKLLDGAKVNSLLLGDMIKLQRGKRLVKSQLEESGNYAVYQNSMKPLGYYHESNVASDTTFIICAGAAGEIGYSKVEFWAADDVYICLTSGNVLSKFVYYFLLSKQHNILSQVRRASIPRLSKTVIEKLKIPIPCPDNPKKSLAIQAEIVRILDKFDTLTHSISEGLPREIKLRQQQYEHYRDELLNFPKSKKINI